MLDAAVLKYITNLYMIRIPFELVIKIWDPIEHFI